MCQRVWLCSGNLLSATQSFSGIGAFGVTSRPAFGASTPAHSQHHALLLLTSYCPCTPPPSAACVWRGTELCRIRCFRGSDQHTCFWRPGQCAGIWCVYNPRFRRLWRQQHARIWSHDQYSNAWRFWHAWISWRVALWHTGLGDRVWGTCERRFWGCSNARAAGECVFFKGLGCS
jgi:hypothetical protein